MRAVFYTNMDNLGTGWGSRFDFLVAGMTIAAVVAAVFTYFMISGEDHALGAKMGPAVAYAGTLLGAGLHFHNQTKKGDELVCNILNKAVARSGMSTLIFVALFTLYAGVKGDQTLGMWTLLAPVMFLAIAWKQARLIARTYTN